MIERLEISFIKKKLKHGLITQEKDNKKWMLTGV